MIRMVGHLKRHVFRKVGAGCVSLPHHPNSLLPICKPGRFLFIKYPQLSLRSFVCFGGQTCQVMIHHSKTLPQRRDFASLNITPIPYYQTCKPARLCAITPKLHHSTTPLLHQKYPSLFFCSMLPS